MKPSLELMISWEIEAVQPSLFLTCLLRDAGGGGFGSLRISQIEVSQRREVVVELVDERNSGRYVQLDDLALAHVVEVLHQRAQAVAVRREQHPLIVANRRRHGLVPVRQEPRDR